MDRGRWSEAALGGDGEGRGTQQLDVRKQKHNREDTWVMGRIPMRGRPSFSLSPQHQYRKTCLFAVSGVPIVDTCAQWTGNRRGSRLLGSTIACFLVTGRVLLQRRSSANGCDSVGAIEQ